MIVSYDDTIMDKAAAAPNRVKFHRQTRGWSQAELASRAKVSRAAVSAIEVGRLVPSVSAALAIATAFGCTVEDLFGRAAEDANPVWASPPSLPASRYWMARVGGRLTAYPAEMAPAGNLPHDGVYRQGAFVHYDPPDPDATLVVASCDPAAGLLASVVARSSGIRLLVIPRSSGEALALLARGAVHAAGVHYATREDPDGNSRAVREAIGPGYRLLRVAGWEEGLAVGNGSTAANAAAAVRGGGRWVGREPGSAAHRCQVELLGSRRPPTRLARDHRGVAEAVRAGWADFGVCHQLAAVEAGVRFLGVREEGFDLCFPLNSQGDRRIDALIRSVRSAAYRRTLGDVPGCETSETGELQSAT
jgi:molybdate-binding protein/DNA-binding XRE family transcriptional regulator